MKVLLLTDVPSVGKQGQIVQVKDGYGRNFLIGRGLARLADAIAVRDIETANSYKIHKAAIKKDAVHKAQAGLSNTALYFARKANEKGGLFAAVTNSDISEALNKKGFSTVSVAQVIGGPFKTVGAHKVTLKLNEKDISLRITVQAS
jgi:large subunit ribosomal protein L9